MRAAEEELLPEEVLLPLLREGGGGEGILSAAEAKLLGTEILFSPTDTAAPRDGAPREEKS